jgi:hypothetical protein
MFLSVKLSLQVTAHNVGVDTLVLDENKGPFLPSKSYYVRSFWVHLVYVA